MGDVSDVPGDQGGWVRITIDRSQRDDEAELEYPIATYNVWQRIDDPAMLAVLARSGSSLAIDAVANEAASGYVTDALGFSGWPVKELNGRYFVQSKELFGAAAFPPGTWEILGSFAACQQDQYVYRASSVADSSASGIAYSVYVVSAHSTTPSMWFLSEPDSGYSVDNLAPAPPGGFSAEQSFVPEGLAIAWVESGEPDLHHYAVHRGTSEDFEPDPGNLIASPEQAEYFDDEWRWSSGYYYKICAVDVHGNESGFALLKPDDVTGVEPPKIPAVTYLRQNYPNPFNPTTTIAFGLKEPTWVSLKVYDSAGRLVRTLAEGDRPAGHYVETWDGRNMRGENAASGVYFSRLDAGSLSQTRKMILLR